LLAFEVVRGAGRTRRALGVRAGREVPLAPPSRPGRFMTQAQLRAWVRSPFTNLCGPQKMGADKGGGWGRRGLSVFEDSASLRHLVLLLLMCGLTCAVPLRSGDQSVVLSSDARWQMEVSYP